MTDAEKVALAVKTLKQLKISIEAWDGPGNEVHRRANVATVIFGLIELMEMDNEMPTPNN